MKSIATDSGTTVSIEEHAGLTLVILTAPAAPPGMQRVEVGRVVDGGGFQVIPFMAFALRPAVLRAIADLVEAEVSR